MTEPASPEPVERCPDCDRERAILRPGVNTMQFCVAASSYGERHHECDRLTIGRLRAEIKALRLIGPDCPFCGFTGAHGCPGTAPVETPEQTAERFVGKLHPTLGFALASRIKAHIERGTKTLVAALAASRTECSLALEALGKAQAELSALRGAQTLNDAERRVVEAAIERYESGNLRGDYLGACGRLNSATIALLSLRKDLNAQ